MSTTVYFGEKTFNKAMDSYVKKMGVSYVDLVSYISEAPDGAEFEFDICDAFVCKEPFPKMLDYLYK